VKGFHGIAVTYRGGPLDGKTWTIPVPDGIDIMQLLPYHHLEPFPRDATIEEIDAMGRRWRDTGEQPPGGDRYVHTRTVDGRYVYVFQPAGSVDA